MRGVQIERDIGRPPEVVFDWFTTPELLVQWWPDEADLDVVVGGAYRLHWSGPDVTLRGTYLTVEQPGNLAFTWSWDHDELPARQVVVALAESATGTSVTIDHEAATAEEGADYREGWTFFLDRLATRLNDG